MGLWEATVNDRGSGCFLHMGVALFCFRLGGLRTFALGSVFDEQMLHVYDRFTWH